MFRCGYVSGPVFFIICLDQHVYLNKACARATSDWVIGCLAVAEDWTERVPLDQHVYFNKVCARATSDWVIGCLAVAEYWTERVPLDQLFR